MPPTALFIEHRTLPGKRGEMVRIWERHVKPRVEGNPAHLFYFFCEDALDPDVVRVFQLYESDEAMSGFLGGEWYQDYLLEVSAVVIAPPRIFPAPLVWSKTAPSIHSHPPIASPHASCSA
ncbi:MAG: Antibiotic biosynthesis monooxygenase [Verrucomicrobiales bacterium]|nr:Antibiotic biosynthesis monooxygenase [Verrucomicrobiales bacterium]